MDFYLNCWVPSLSSFVKTKEIKNYQLINLSKYILNEDHPGTNKCFDDIIKENLFIPNNVSLTRFDKWFVLCFLRATNISPILYMQTTNKEKAICNIEISLFDILTSLSEINPINTLNLKLEKVAFALQPGSSLYSKEPVIESIQVIENDTTRVTEQPVISKLLETNINLRNYLAQEMLRFDNSSTYFILKNNNTSLNLNDLQVRVYDNTLFHFTRSIYLPHCKGLYEKHYNLMKCVRLSYDEIKQITPAESEIFLNLYKQEEAAKSQPARGIQ